MTTQPQQAEALAWLAGRLRWERLLTELNQRTDATDQPAALEAPVPARAA